MVSARYIAGILVGGLVAGCGAEQIEQQVTGGMRVQGRPASKLALRLQTGNRQTCDSQYLSLATDANGSFSATRRAELGVVAVIVQQDTLCVFEGEKWLPIWHGIYGPAPTVIAFLCDRTGKGWKCTMNGMESHGEA